VALVDALRFTVRRGRDERRAEPLRAWLRRPDLLRIGTLDAQRRQIVREPPTTLGVLTLDGNDARPLPWPGTTEQPPLVRTGLFRRRQ
jgi:hypothetical protein